MVRRKHLSRSPLASRRQILPLTRKLRKEAEFGGRTRNRQRQSLSVRPLFSKIDQHRPGSTQRWNVYRTVEWEICVEMLIFRTFGLQCSPREFPSLELSHRVVFFNFLFHRLFWWITLPARGSSESVIPPKQPEIVVLLDQLPGFAVDLASVSPVTLAVRS